MVQSSQEGGTVSLEKRDPRRLPRDPSLYPSLSLQSVLLAKCMWLKWNKIWIFSHQPFKFHRQVIDSTNLGISALLRSSVVTSVTC